MSRKEPPKAYTLPGGINQWPEYFELDKKIFLALSNPSDSLPEPLRRRKSTQAFNPVDESLQAGLGSRKTNNAAKTR